MERITFEHPRIEPYSGVRLEINDAEKGARVYARVFANWANSNVPDIRRIAGRRFVEVSGNENTVKRNRENGSINEIGRQTDATARRDYGLALRSCPVRDAVDRNLQIDRRYTPRTDHWVYREIRLAEFV